jgi:hypothetical protein
MKNSATLLLKTLQRVSQDIPCHVVHPELNHFLELPENSPRFVLLSRPVSYSDGRKSYPIVLLNWVPATCEIGMFTLHASSLATFQNAVSQSCLGMKFCLLIMTLGRRHEGHRVPRWSREFNIQRH